MQRIREIVRGIRKLEGMAPAQNYKKSYIMEVFMAFFNTPNPG